MEKDPFSKGVAFRASIFVSLVVNMVLIMGVFYGRSRTFMSEMQIGWDKYLAFFLWHFGCNVLLFFLLFLFNFYIIKKRWGSKKRTLTAFVGTILICFVLSPCLSQFQWYVVGGNNGLAMSGFTLFNIIKDFVSSFIVLLITHEISISQKKHQMMLANQKLREENIRIKYEALKNQLDPHFLFNSLNTLSGLIGMDDDKAHDYVDNLSSVFRYTLHSKNIGTLDEEIEFVDSYVTLLKIRYGDNLSVRYKVDGRYRDYYIMPASLQLLVENAVKHNVISNKKPLHIDIMTTEDDNIVVSNVINEKSDKSIGGIGLGNLSDRYSILFGLQVGICNTGDTFSVAIPLMKEIDKKVNI